MEEARSKPGFGAECLQAFIRDTPPDPEVEGKGDMAFIGAVLVWDLINAVRKKG